MQNFMKLDTKKFLDLKAVTFGVWGLKTSLGQFGPKGCISSFSLLFIIGFNSFALFFYHNVS